MTKRATQLFVLIGLAILSAVAVSSAQDELPQHWAYQKLVRPVLPEVKNKDWARNPIDRFVLARLERAGLTPSPEAERAVLLRRVYLDLTGLPPSVKEVDEFLADNSPDAYEKVVDRLLASPHYGERWARPWLDLARYADSNGFVQDSPRMMWMYRDWVINALNSDMPFDRFTTEQLAGDMLPNATIAQRIATGFHRNTLLNQEGGIDIEEARWETLVDRVNTTATVWLGATLACAQCHNHKYDPFSQRDYYRFMAFFDNGEYKVSYRDYFDKNIEEPTLELPAPEQMAKRDALNAEIARLEQQLKTQTPALDVAQTDWERGIVAAQTDWLTLDVSTYSSTGGATLTKLEDKSLLAGGANVENEIYVINTSNRLEKVTALRLELMPDERLPKGGPGRNPYGNCQLSGIELEANGRRIQFKDMAVDNSSGKVEAAKFLKGEQAWVIDATRDSTRIARQAVFVLAEPVAAAELTIRLKQSGRALGQNLGRFRLSVTSASQPLRITNIPARLSHLLAVNAERRTEAQSRELAAHYRSISPELDSARTQLADLRVKLNQLAVPGALVLQERQNFERPSTLFRERGSYLSPGERVYAATPKALPPMPESAPFNRIGLARWLTDERNPLTARVAVNRAWEQFFGRGLVETSEDFGLQSSPPSHPELLDWLAVEFRNPVSQFTVHGSQPQQNANREPRTANWSQKSLHRLIVTSATYRQSSEQNPQSAIRNPQSQSPQSDDPDNRLLGRGPRFRMEAEMVRDTMLAASGLLSRKLGGPSVFPPQPESVWANNYIADKYKESDGADRFRRSLYTFIRRTAPPPGMVTFDATTREICTVRRVRTNTPLQALTLLNDEASFEIARGLAKRMLAEAESKEAASLAKYGFRLCRSRAPKPAELERLVQLYEQQRANFSQNPKAASEVGKSKHADAELAAWTMVANVLLNLDGTITKE